MSVDHSPANSPRPCWCGQERLEPFAEHFARCPDCGTLVFAGACQPPEGPSTGEDGGLYGTTYWFERQVEVHGCPDLVDRARADLPERCVHWLRTLLTYRPPPARVLELGCAHAGFVALLGWAGYSSTGLEMSRSVAHFGREAFGVPVLVGPVEEQSLQAGSFDVIVAMDVLEHLPDPEGTLELCASLLAPDGLLLLQTPKYPDGKALTALRETSDPFVSHMVPDGEHLFLFSQSSVTRLLSTVGFPHVVFPEAIFAHYDMCIVASRSPIVAARIDESIGRLDSPPTARLVRALLNASEGVAAIEKDRAARLEVIRRLDAENTKLRERVECLELASRWSPLLLYRYARHRFGLGETPESGSREQG